MEERLMKKRSLIKSMTVCFLTAVLFVSAVPAVYAEEEASESVHEEVLNEEETETLSGGEGSMTEAVTEDALSGEESPEESASDEENVTGPAAEEAAEEPETVEEEPETVEEEPETVEEEPEAAPEEAPAAEEPETVAEEPEAAAEEAPAEEVPAEEAQENGVLETMAAGDKAINSTNFPDAGFRKYLTEVILEEYDKDDNGLLSKAERNKVEKIEITGYTCKNLKGLNLFPALKELWVQGIGLKELDVTGNTGLTMLYCSANDLTELDVNKNTALKELSVSGNYLTELTIGTKPSLTYLGAYDNELTALDLSGCTALERLFCSSNKLTSLDTASCTNLKYISASGNNISKLNISKNTLLEDLWLGDNAMKTLDLSKNTNLKRLGVENNKLKTIAVRKNDYIAEVLKEYDGVFSAYDDDYLMYCYYLYDEEYGEYFYNTYLTCDADTIFMTRTAFGDVPLTHNFAKYIYWAYNEGITGGIGNTGNFGVNDKVTRGQVVMFLWRAAGKPEPEKNTQTFKDVPVKHSFYKAVQWASESGITAGYTGSKKGYFGVNDSCTRGQIVTFMWRFAFKPAAEGKTQVFPDVPVKHSYFQAVQWAYENAITTGYKNGKFGVNDTCTRGQCVTFLYRLMHSSYYLRSITDAYEIGGD